MKKIFAIALALVMVFSMASAFALNACSTFDWTCSTTATACGKAKVEVVPYVVVNDGCGDIDYEVSTCATAIKTQKVFFAVKLTVEPNLDEKWWNEAELTFKLTGLKKFNAGFASGKVYEFDMTSFNPYVDGSDELKKSEAQVWYLDDFDANGDAVWAYAGNENFDIEKMIFNAEVDVAKKAKVCATLASDHTGFNTWTYGDYTVTVATGTDAKSGTLTITDKCNNKFEMTWADGKVNKVEAKDAFMAEVVAKFNLTGCVVGTCVDNDIVQRNFGWKDKFESCFSWSDKGASVVNPECVVTLPKTGDASLLWWLF